MNRDATDRFAGNGGLSLRRVSAIRQVLRFQARYNDSAPEDEWFGQRLYIMPGLRVASGLEGALAVENVYMEKPMGFHVQGMGDNLHPDVWQSYERRKKILEYCPELHTVLKAKLDRERCAGDTKDGGGFHIDGRLAFSLEALSTNTLAVIHPTPEEMEAERLKQQQEQEARRKSQEAALKKLQEERKKQEAEEAKRKKEEEEAKKKEEENKKKLEEEAARNIGEEAKKKQEMEAAKKVLEEEAAKKAAAAAAAAATPPAPVTTGASQPNELKPSDTPKEPIPKPEASKPEGTAATETPQANTT
jgi:flagellar biosynthesis GTPase FlhF